MPRRTRRQLEQLIRHFPENGLKMLLHGSANVREMLTILNFEQVDRLDFSKMKVRPATFIPRDFRHVESDLVLTIPFRPNSGSRKSVTIYILIEHQSEPDSLMSFRILDYVVQILKSQLREAKKSGFRPSTFRFQPVVPIVFYTGFRPWPAIAELQELFEAADIFQNLLPKIKPLFLNVSLLEKQQLEHPDRLFGWILRLLQEREADKHSFETILKATLDLGAEIPEIEIERWKEVLTYLHHFVYHYRSPTEAEGLGPDIEIAARARGLEAEVQIMKMTMAEALRREGRLEERKKRLRMLLESKREDLVALLTANFGEIADDIQKKIEAETDLDVLKQWFNLGLSARTLEQVGIA